MKYIIQKYEVACNRCGDIPFQNISRAFYEIGNQCKKCKMGTYEKRLGEQWSFDINCPRRKEQWVAR